MNPRRPNLADLPEVLPVFPLPGALLLPRARLPLHIFEPRYLAMIEDCLKTRERLIGMIQPLEATPDGLHAVGCAGRLTGFSETEDGRYMITLTGISRFRIRHEAESGFTPWRRCAVDWSEFKSDLSREAETDGDFDRTAFLDNLDRYFTRRQLATDWDNLKDAEPELLINALAMLCPFSPKEKQALLEAPKLCNRREMLETLVEFALRGSGSGNDEVMQ